MSETYTPLEATGLQGAEKYRTRIQVSGGSETQHYFDSLQREIRTATKAFAANSYATATTTYDALGRKKQIAKPAGGGTVTTTYGTVGNLDGYDVLNRPTSEVTSGGAISLASQYAYGGFASLTVDGAAVNGGATTAVTQSGTSITTRTTTRYTNSQGQTVRVVDGEGGATDFAFDAYGNLAKSIGPTGIAELMGYDRRGRKTSLSNPDSGSWSYQYNGGGELVTQIDAKGQTTVLFYDALGRTIERREHRVTPIRCPSSRCRATTRTPTVRRVPAASASCARRARRRPVDPVSAAHWRIPKRERTPLSTPLAGPPRA